MAFANSASVNNRPFVLSTFVIVFCVSRLKGSPLVIVFCGDIFAIWLSRVRGLRFSAVFFLDNPTVKAHQLASNSSIIRASFNGAAKYRSQHRLRRRLFRPRPQSCYSVYSPICFSGTMRCPSDSRLCCPWD